MTETSQTHVVTELPAPKRRRPHNPFRKDETVENTETTRKGISGVYLAGIILVAGGAVAAVSSKLRKHGDNEDVEGSSDNTPTDS